MRSNRMPRNGSKTSSPPGTSPTGTSSGAASPTSAPTMLELIDKRISSPASAVGRTLCVSPDGRMTFLSGPEAVPASPSAPPVDAGASATIATSGPSGSISSASALLQSSLASRLRALTASSGSTLFALTWKARVTPSGHQICALRASGLRTSDNASTSWPSPTVNDAKGSAYSYANGDHNRPCLKLVGAARLASWATPASREPGGTPEQFLARKEKARANGSQSGISLTALSLQAQLANWPTPTVHDAERGGQAKRAMGETRHGSNLQDFVLLTNPGAMSSGSLARTAKPGQLNPSHSRWLMGYPEAWDESAPKSSKKQR